MGKGGGLQDYGLSLESHTIIATESLVLLYLQPGDYSLAQSKNSFKMNDLESLTRLVLHTLAFPRSRP